MAVSDGDIAAALDLFDPLGDLTTRKMMGGLCIYHNGTIFALLMSDGQLYLKTTGALIDKMVAMGSTQWQYTRKDKDTGKDKKPVFMPYWTMPDEALEDPELACELAQEALNGLDK